MQICSSTGINLVKCRKIKLFADVVGVCPILLYIRSCGSKCYRMGEKKKGKKEAVKS